eukprot:CAMPEP_0202916182 /NCGR_PEP_ID=MMETSP1392-20130828/67882_1 /ASSEMBLY_ACC=CAM_ASM_000868 /TAXON_ID=225041 /ORGANISM="Chlamydomonas chlamydogama, Strain SAG 11-48b" /LENGTH=101 /DNA_ID=CAMNT_0049608507 /DNA_START=937 /DNA_END=1242 /DNA_ORIENTATION=+
MAPRLVLLGRLRGAELERPSSAAEGPLGGRMLLALEGAPPSCLEPAPCCSQPPPELWPTLGEACRCWALTRLAATVDVAAAPPAPKLLLRALTSSMLGEPG